MRIIFRSLALLVFIVAIVQLFGIGDRIISALWQWYKFYGYGNDGHITISYFMVGITATVSIVAICIGILVAKYSREAFIAKSALVSSLMLMAGFLSLSALLISPLASIVSR